MFTVRIGIIGLPLAGKTTLFNLLCDSSAATSAFIGANLEPNRGMAKVPDSRLDWLGQHFAPRRPIYCQIDTTDLPGLRLSESSSANTFLQQVRQVDALVHVVRSYREGVEHLSGSIDPLRDLDNVQAELLLADLDLIEKRFERINAGRKIITEQRAEMAVLEKCRAALEAEQPLASLGLTKEEEESISQHSFLSQLPQLVVINQDEEQFKAKTFPRQEEVEAWIAARGYHSLVVCAAMEEEIAKLPEEDKELFMEDLGVDECGSYRLARGMHALMGYISFFTVGDDQVRAWTLQQGQTARKAAGRVHSDMEKGFIRAETVAFTDLVEHGSFPRLKELGMLRLEGRDYIVKDGDILQIRFNL